MFNLKELANMPRADRMAYVREHEQELAGESYQTLQKVGTLLAVTAPKNLREKYPIQFDEDGDLVSLEGQNI